MLENMSKGSRFSQCSILEGSVERQLVSDYNWGDPDSDLHTARKLTRGSLSHVLS